MKIFLALLFTAISLEIFAQPGPGGQGMPAMSAACQAAFPQCQSYMQDFTRMKQCMEEKGCTMPAGGPPNGGPPQGGAQGGMPPQMPQPQQQPQSPEPETATNTEAALPEARPADAAGARSPRTNTTRMTEEVTGENTNTTNCAQVSTVGREVEDDVSSGPTTSNASTATGQ